MNSNICGRGIFQHHLRGNGRIEKNIRLTPADRLNIFLQGTVAHKDSDDLVIRTRFKSLQNQAHSTAMRQTTLVKQYFLILPYSQLLTKVVAILQCPLRRSIQYHNWPSHVICLGIPVRNALTDHNGHVYMLD